MIKPAKFREIIDQRLVFQICWRVFKRIENLPVSLNCFNADESLWVGIMCQP